jgi:Uma2 family endonuclease
MNVRLHPAAPPVEYPDSDGQPMSENTKQYRWIVTIQENLDALFRDRPDVLVAADNLIYAQEGDPKIRQAPDVYVAFGRPTGDRGSYKVWEEGNIFPQVIFEVLSPGNRAGELARKFVFYERYGAEEYYIYDPDRNRLEGYARGADGLDDIPVMHDWVSPRLGVRFDLSGPELVIRFPDGRPFLTVQELTDERDRLVAEREKLTVERDRLAAERDAERARAAGFAAKLRELGFDPGPN